MVGSKWGYTGVIQFGVIRGQNVGAGSSAPTILVIRCIRLVSDSDSDSGDSNAVTRPITAAGQWTPATSCYGGSFVLYIR